jgi:tRNA (uracil-5-)-methyltransferase
MMGVRKFRRLSHIDISSYTKDCVLVDPPRSGLDGLTISLIKRFEVIIYISCNYKSLLENLKELKEYQIEKLFMYDQFPYTNHIELGVILRRQ